MKNEVKLEYAGTPWAYKLSPQLRSDLLYSNTAIVLGSASPPRNDYAFTPQYYRPPGPGGRFLETSLRGRRCSPTC